MVTDKAFWTWVALLLVGRAFDLWTTWVVTPTLEHEVNPVAVQAQMGWGPLIVYSYALACVVILLFWWAYRIQHRVLPDPPAARLMEFLGHVWLGDRDARWRLLWAFPRETDRWIWVTGIAVMVALTAASFMAGISNLLMGAGTHPLLGMSLPYAWHIGILYGTIILAALTASTLHLVHLHKRHAAMVAPGSGA